MADCGGIKLGAYLSGRYTCVGLLVTTAAPETE